MKDSNPLFSKLNKFIRKYYVNQLIKGGILTLLILLLFSIFISILEHYMNFNVGFRTFLFWLYITINIIIFSKFLVIPSLKLFKIRRGISHTDAAKILGEHFNEIDDKLVNIIELSNMTPNNELINASIEQKTKEISPVSFANAIKFKSSLKKAKWLLLPLLP